MRPRFLNRLKDSDVTWLYGPLHTAVDAVPPPKIATASDRLGLEPLRSLSDSKKPKKVVVVTKPILKYRSLSDILLPPGGISPASPILESFGMDFSSASVTYAKSDSNLARLNREANRKRSASPHIPRGGQDSSSEEPALSDSSSTSGATTRNGDRRHISFNHRVEQCIAVDSSDETSVHRPANDSSGSEDGDDEDEVLTFKSSTRVAQAAANFRRLAKGEPFTIHRLGPTTLKSLELYPSPSPAVVHQNRPGDDHSIAQSSYGHPVATYTSRPTTSGQSNPRAGAYDYATMNPGGLPQSQWEEEEDYAMGFDYFNGPEVGVGDEYDMAQYGSTHLVSYGSVAAGPPYTPYPTGPGPYSPDGMSKGSSSGSGSGSGSNSPSAGPTASSPGQLSMMEEAQARGLHTPTSSSKESLVPKRSILKNRSRQNSDNSDDLHNTPRLDSGLNTPSMVSPNNSVPPSPTLSSAQSSPYNSASSLAAVMARAGIPSVVHLRESNGGVRRVDSTELVREARGRSTSRGSSSSLERSASADRRTGASISPSSSYTPPSSVSTSSSSTTLAPRATGLPGSRSRSSESLLSLGGGSMAGRELMPNVPEASSESEAETVLAGDQNEEVKVRRPRVIDDVDSNIPIVVVIDEGFSADVLSIAETLEGEDDTIMESILASTSSAAPIFPALPSSSGGALRYRQPSPSAPTTSSTSTAEEERGGSSDIILTGSPTISVEDVDSGSLNEEDSTRVPSYARRSLLRAARGGGHGSISSDREGSIGGRSSIESGRGGPHDDSYGFGYYDEDTEGGIVSRTLEVAGTTVRDLLGALSRGILWRRDPPNA